MTWNTLGTNGERARGLEAGLYISVHRQWTDRKWPLSGGKISEDSRIWEKMNN